MSKVNYAEAIQAATSTLMAQLSTGGSSALKDYLAASAHFRRYSFGNQLLIATQAPHSTRVAGFHTWKSMGRSVRKGEKGIGILAPLIGKARQGDASSGNDSKATQVTDSSEVNGVPKVYGFRYVYVFDVSQTDGEELPSIDLAMDVAGDLAMVKIMRARLGSFLGANGIELAYDDSILPALGVSYGGRISLITKDIGTARELATLVHETAHELLHKGERRKGMTKTALELEAESVAFIVGSAIGMEMGNASSDYVTMYGGNAELLRESLGAVQGCAKRILEAIEHGDAVGVEEMPVAA